MSDNDNGCGAAVAEIKASAELQRTSRYFISKRVWYFWQSRPKRKGLRRRSSGR